MISVFIIMNILLNRYSSPFTLFICLLEIYSFGLVLSKHSKNRDGLVMFLKTIPCI
jgi:hypothetical protein